MSEENRLDTDIDEKKLKNVTIRGIDSDIYDEFSHQMKMLDMTIGDAVSKMMRDITKDLDDSFANFDVRSPFSTKRLFGRLQKVSISQHDKLEISGKDLIDANVRVSISHVDKLTILPDVTRDLFEKYIRSISHCGTVRMPSILPKLLLLSKVTFCDKIEIYQSNNHVTPTEQNNTPASYDE